MYIVGVAVLAPHIESLIVGRFNAKVNFGAAGFLTPSDLLSCGPSNRGFVSPVKLKASLFDGITELQDPLRIWCKQIINEMDFFDAK